MSEVKAWCVRNMNYSFNILGTDIAVKVSYVCTYPGAPECGPSYSSGGEPAEPPEFDIHVQPFNETGNLECPDWLYDLMVEDEKLYVAICDDWQKVKEDEED